jgi:hypothetical protein
MGFLSIDLLPAMTDAKMISLHEVEKLMVGLPGPLVPGTFAHAYPTCDGR